mgnify:CR=1 FL=1
MSKEEIKMEEMQEEELEQVSSMLFCSKLGSRYYPTEKTLEKKLGEGLKEGDHILAIRSGGELIGLLWFQMQGAFYMFPYLHMIFIKEQFQGKGLGGQILRYFEDYVLNGEQKKLKNKIFLLVGDWNKGAMKFYEKMGYVMIGTIPELFRKKTDEHLLMKECKRA